MANRGRVLVTGAAGFTGHHLVMHAVEAGFDVRATDISSRYYGPLFDALGVEFAASDITRAESLAPLVDGVDAVFHVAGIHDYSTPDGVMHAINVEGVDRICAAAVEAGVERLIHLSSAGVYGYDWHDGTPVAEDAAKLTPPLNNYNITKWEGEKVVNRYQRDHGLRATVFRPAAIYGPRSEYGLFNAFKQVAKERDRNRMLMVGRGECLEGFVHVTDLCRAVVFACDSESMAGDVYNVADDSRITTAEFFNLICKELHGVEKSFLRVPKPLLLPVASASQLVAKMLGKKSLLERATLHYLSCDRVWDNTKLKRTGFAFDYPTIQDGLGETLRWYIDNGWL
jgi:nucleoside-diphosphate-sugar epimerase